jgi:Cu/Ag efflux protein CusF
MKKSLLLAALLATAGLNVQAQTAAPAAAPAAEVAPVAAEVTVMTATVDSVNAKTRTVMLKNDQGQLAPMTVGKSVSNFNKIKKGDTFVVEYAQAVVVGLVAAPKGTQPNITATRTVKVQDQANKKPFAEEIDTIKATAVIKSIDAKARTAEITMPDGKVNKVKVDKSVLGLENFKVGDDVVVEYVQDMAVGFVATPKK